MIACMNYSLGLNQHQGGGLGQMAEIVIIWPALPSLNYAHRFSSDVTDGRWAEICPVVRRAVCSSLLAPAVGDLWKAGASPTGSCLGRDACGGPAAELSSSV